MAIQLSKYKDRGNLHMKIRIKINTNVIFIFLFVCVIISMVITTFSAVSITLKSIPYNNKTLSFYADCIKFHVKANGYANKVKDDVDNNLYLYSPPGPGRDLQPANAKMQGYGNYVFKEDTSLFDFIKFCYDINPQMTIACSVYNGETELNSCDYTKLCTYTSKKMNSNSMTHVNNFWTNMTNQLGEVFNSYQDLYFYDRYTNKGACLVFNPNKLESNGKEFLTCMMSYIFSNNQNSAFSLEVKKGDIVPFLYVKEHTDNNDIKNDPKEIAKFAYLANINGWSDTTSNDLWLEEYESIFGEYDEDALCELVEEDISTLAEWYTETDEKYQNQKGNKGNALLGSSIDEIIQSDYSIVQQLEATDYYLQTIEGIGDYKENMARNELMARYMMENSHISDIIKDYSVGIDFITENLQRGTSESKNTNTAVLSDFQVLEFDHRLDKDGQSDEDSLSDLTELTNNTKWVNITGPAEKMYIDMFNKGKTTKTQEAAFEDLVKKNPGMVKYEGGKLYYKTYDYDSNPMLNDTDFDGLNDDGDSKKIDGKFSGYASKIGQVEYTSDYRYFFVNNDKYNDELSAMSLMMSNLANGGLVPMHNGQVGIDSYLRNVGFGEPLHKTSFKISETENITGDLYLCKKTIQVGANKKSVKRYKDVYGIFIGGFDTEYNYKKLLANFNKEEIAKYYDNIATDIMTYINVNQPATTNSYCYWVTGYSVAGGIAGEVASRLANSGEVYCYTFGATNVNKSGSGAYACIKNVINEDDLYPKINNVEEGLYRSGSLYNDSIYDNLQREYKKLGNNYRISPKRTNTIKKYIKDVRESVTREDWIDIWVTKLSKYLNDYRMIMDIFDSILNPIQSYNSTKLKKILNENNDGVEKAHGIRSYYVLSKSLNGFDLNNDDIGWTEFDETLTSEEEIGELTEVDEEYQERLNLLLEAIETVGKAYLDNVYTYQGADDTLWDIETRITDLDTTRNAEHVTETITGQDRVLKTSTVNSYEKWNEHKDRIKDKHYQDITFDEYKQKRIMPMVPDDDNKKSLHHLDILDDYKRSPKITIKNYDKDIDVLYKDGDEDYRADKGSFVCDDCSSFAAAVYWYYLNQLEESKDKDKIDLWYTGSSHFTSTTKLSNIINTLLKNDIEIYQWDTNPNTKLDDKHNIYIRTDFELQPGDLLYRKEQKGKSAHIEFYLGDNHSFGWGKIQSSYSNANNSKHFKIIRDLDVYNIGKTRKADQVSSGERYRIEGNGGAGIYNTVKAYDSNCRYDYVIRLAKKTNVVGVGNE